MSSAAIFRQNTFETACKILEVRATNQRPQPGTPVTSPDMAKYGVPRTGAPLPFRVGPLLQVWTWDIHATPGAHQKCAGPQLAVQPTTENRGESYSMTVSNKSNVDAGAATLHA